MVAKVRNCFIFWIIIGIILMMRHHLAPKQIIIACSLIAGGTLITILLTIVEKNMPTPTQIHYKTLKQELINIEQEISSVTDEIRNCCDSRDNEGLRFWNNMRLELVTKREQQKYIIDTFRRDLSKARNKAITEGDTEAVKRLMF